MRQRCYRISFVVMLVLAVYLFGIKILENYSNVAIETNYIGDMEQENNNKDNNENSESNSGHDIEAEESEAIVDKSQISVLLKNNDYTNIYHDNVTCASENGMKVTYGEEEVLLEEFSIYAEETELFICLDGVETILEGMEFIEIMPVNDEDTIQISTIERSYGQPQYYGTLKIFVVGNQFVIVNKLDLEWYLRGVLPSEMPATYELEALKAQAICARSYAYNHMEEYDYPEYNAHIDDSTSYQVYNNLEEGERCNQAIEETKGQMLQYNEEVITAYFFSTSCGVTTTVEAWNGEEEKYPYLQSVSVSDGTNDYEKDLAWYQWSISISETSLEEILETNLEIEINGLQSLKVTKRGAGDVAIELEIVGDDSSVIVETEYDIRAALGSGAYTIELNDGTLTGGRDLLPSAFFDIEYVEGTYILEGGGFGHGIGMSQNGANEMAKLGMSCEEILEFFYEGVGIS